LTVADSSTGSIGEVEPPLAEKDARRAVTASKARRLIRLPENQVEAPYGLRRNAWLVSVETDPWQVDITGRRARRIMVCAPALDTGRRAERPEWTS